MAVHKQLSSARTRGSSRLGKKGTENNENRHTSSVRHEARNGSVWVKK